MSNFQNLKDFFHLYVKELKNNKITKSHFSQCQKTTNDFLDFFIKTKKEINSENIFDFLKAKKYKLTTLKLKFTILKGFLNKFDMENHGQDLFNIKKIKIPNYVNKQINKSLKIETFTDQEINTILEQIDIFFKHKKTRLSMKFTFLFLLKNGCRRGEFLKVCKNTNQWIWNDELKIFYVQNYASKNGNQRNFIIPEAYNENFKEIIDNTLWNSISSINYAFVKFSKYLNKNFGFSKFNTHKLRKTRITNFIKQGYTYEQIQRFTGHKSILTIQNHYVDNNAKTYLEDFAQATK